MYAHFVVIVFQCCKIVNQEVYTRKPLILSHTGACYRYFSVFQVLLSSIDYFRIYSCSILNSLVIRLTILLEYYYFAS